MRHTLSLDLPPALDSLAALGTQLRPFLESHYGTVPACYEVELAAVELFSNVVRHNTPATAVRLSCHCWARAVVLTLRDDGFAFDMSAHCPAEPPDPLQEGGRGIWLIHALGDRFGYRRSHDRNLHTFIKRITEPATARPRDNAAPRNSARH